MATTGSRILASALASASVSALALWLSCNPPFDERLTPPWLAPSLAPAAVAGARAGAFLLLLPLLAGGGIAGFAACYAAAMAGAAPLILLAARVGPMGLRETLGSEAAALGVATAAWGLLRLDRRLYEPACFGLIVALPLARAAAGDLGGAAPSILLVPDPLSLVVAPLVGEGFPRAAAAYAAAGLFLAALAMRRGGTTA